MTTADHRGRARTSAAPTPRAARPRSCASSSRTSAPSWSWPPPSTSSSGRSPRSASASASPPRWVTPCWPTSRPTVAPGVDVVFLDTGYHFPETIGTRDAVEATLHVNLINDHARADRRRAGRRSTARTCSAPTPTCAASCARSSRWRRPWPGTTRGPPGCVAPRPTTASSRPVIGWDATQGQGQGLPASPAGPTSRSSATSPTTASSSTRCVYDGYPSIGCWPCTRRVAPGDDPRSGRWAGTNKTECGIHS